ncbi:MAG: bifunctional 2-polyprenyl-6-hydroxyphenol methylase/3-demethylubiquinol 3-O-methyltransferase UbiG [Gammaproteobacteria bacterium]
MNNPNIDRQEVDKFSAMASSWWDPEGDLKTLHHINPIRLDYIDELSGGIRQKTIADIGCGGGILAESMDSKGALITAIDASEEALQVARLHQLESGSKVHYLHSTAEALAENYSEQFDIVTCMELLEHVPSPESIIIACKKLVKPNGYIFLSTLNRTLKAYAFAVLGAEYILNLLPKGTHDYAKFIQPAEIASWLREHNLDLKDLSGMSYNPINNEAALTEDLKVNYLVCAQKQ